MSYLQAFHTSCRAGLSGHAGFQFNAASPGLDSERLSRLAAEHTGYRLPPGSPLEPGPEEIAALPVSLRYLPVDGVGPVVSRTAYVGREFRGRGDEPDGGRFGNYFSHIVVGEEGFGGLHPIELWDSPHWSTTESASPELSVLRELQPGPVDLDAVLERLLPARGPALAAVADAALAAVVGGPRLVIVEPDRELAPLWVAWATFALPPDRVTALTFSTFEARPRTADAVRLCVCLPGCDIDFAPYELGAAVAVLDVATTRSDDAGLYGRIAAALAEEGSEAVTAATRRLGPGLEAAAAAAALAAVSGSTGLVEARDLPDVLAALRDRLGELPAALVAASAAALPKADSPAVAAEWSRLYAAAREGGDDEGAAALADESLGRVLDFLAGGGEADLAPVAPGAPAAPSVAVLARWMELVDAAAATPRLAPLALAGSRLGLVGLNAALDRDLAARLAAAFGEPAVREAYEAIAANGGSRVVEAMALRLAAAAVAGGSVEALEWVAADATARAALRRAAAESEGFEAQAAWELLRARGNPGDRERAVAELAALATTESQAATVRRLLGDRGPVRPDEHAALLRGWLAAGRTAPVQDQEAALQALSALGFTEPNSAAPLWEALRAGPAAVRGDPETRAWGLRFVRPPKRRAFADWARECADLLDPGSARPGLPRCRELEELAARRALGCLDEDDYEAGIEALLGVVDESWLELLGTALARGLERTVSPEMQIARFYVGWHGLRRAGEPLLEVALAEGTRDRSAKELEAVGAHLSRSGAESWEEWLERHPPRRAVSRAVRGVLRRGEDR